MNTNTGENLMRQPYHFGSLSSPSKSEAYISQKRLIISGNLCHVKDKIKAFLDQQELQSCKYINSNGEGAFLITLATLNKAKEIQKNIFEYLKTNNIDNIKIQFYEPKDERNVYVKNLPLQYTETQLSELFQPYGNIISKKIIQKLTNNNSIGFVRYTSKEEAEKAIREINNQNLNLLGNDRTVRCEFSKTSNPVSNSESQRLSNNYYSSISVPRFQNFHHQEAPNTMHNYSPNNLFFIENRNPVFDYNQFANQFSNMSVSPNSPYYQGYGATNIPVYLPFTGNYSLYPYIFYSSNNQNYDHHS